MKFLLGFQWATTETKTVIAFSSFIIEKRNKTHRKSLGESRLCGQCPCVSPVGGFIAAPKAAAVGGAAKRKTMLWQSLLVIHRCFDCWGVVRPHEVVVAVILSLQLLLCCYYFFVVVVNMILVVESLFFLAVLLFGWRFGWCRCCFMAVDGVVYACDVAALSSCCCAACFCSVRCGLVPIWWCFIRLPGITFKRPCPNASANVAAVTTLEGYSTVSKSTSTGVGPICGIVGA